MTLFSASRAVVGLVCVTAKRADWTRWVGSLMKCLAEGVGVSLLLLVVVVTLFGSLVLLTRHCCVRACQWCWAIASFSNWL
jgi:hypothetical protein